MGGSRWVRGRVGGWKKGRKGGGGRERSTALWMGESLSLQTQLERTRVPSVISQLGKLRLGESGYAVTPSHWPGTTSAQNKCIASCLNSGPFHTCGAQGPQSPTRAELWGVGQGAVRAPPQPHSLHPGGSLVPPCSAATLALRWRQCHRAPARGPPPQVCPTQEEGRQKEPSSSAHCPSHGPPRASDVPPRLPPGDRRAQM